MMKALETERTTQELINQLQANIPALMEKFKVPGLSLSLLRDAAILWSPSYGVRSVQTGEAVCQETLFEAASLSKPVFAHVALNLCETGILDLDRSLNDYLPAPYIEKQPLLGSISMRHVLSHTTGFPNWRPKGKDLTIHFPPGERFSYSGEGYMYLQAVVEEVTGQEPTAFMSTNLLKPLGMLNSCFTWDSDASLPVAVGHDAKGDATEKLPWEKMMAAASLHCTSVDFAKFLSAVMSPHSDNPSHLRKEMSAEMLKAQVQINDSKPWDSDWPKEKIQIDERVGWGLGWGIQDTVQGRSIWHWGDNGNYRAFAIGWPETGEGIVVMTNGKNGQQVIEKILRDLVGGDYPGLDWLEA